MTASQDDSSRWSFRADGLGVGVRSPHPADSQSRTCSRDAPYVDKIDRQLGIWLERYQKTGREMLRQGFGIRPRFALERYQLLGGLSRLRGSRTTRVKAMAYDAQKDFVPIAHVLEAEGLLVVNPALPVKTVPELIAHLKAQPGKLSYASAGIGTASDLAGELCKIMAGVDMAHIPYKGNAPAITDVMGGQAHMIFATMPTVIQRGPGGLRSVAVIGSTRAKALPDIPTVAETLPGFEVSNWAGLFAPAGTPPEIVRRWNAEVQRVMTSADVQPRLEAEGARFVPTTPESCAAFQRAESARWGKMIREAGIKVNSPSRLQGRTVQKTKGRLMRPALCALRSRGRVETRRSSDRRPRCVIHHHCNGVTKGLFHDHLLSAG